MPTAAVIIIGNEILSGRTRDLNLPFLGKRLAELGIQLLEARVIPDLEQKIIATVQEFSKVFDYVFTTGGIGPTHDDITTASVAAAFEVEVLRNPEAVRMLEQYYDDKHAVNNARLKMADIPAGAKLIMNPVSAAPGFQLHNVFVLPGVPLIMQAMFEGIVDQLAGGDPILTESITTNLRESTIAEGLGRIQDLFTGVSIGSYPFFRGGRLGVNVVLRSTDMDLLQQACEKVSDLVSELGGRQYNLPPDPDTGN